MSEFAFFAQNLREAVADKARHRPSRPARLDVIAANQRQRIAERDRKVEETLKRFPNGLSSADLADLIGDCVESVRLSLQKLKGHGKVQLIGTRNFHLWIAKP